MARYSILINVPQHKLRTLRASLCLTARLTLTPVQIWHVILNAWNVSREPSLCIYDGVLVKWHILEEEMLGMARWLEHPFWVVQKQCAQLHTKRLFVDHRVDVYNALAKFQDRISNIRLDIVFSVSTLLLVSKSIYKNPVYDAHYTHIYINYCCSTYVETYQSV